MNIHIDFSLIYLLSQAFIIWFAWENIKDMKFSEITTWETDEWKQIAGFLCGLTFAPISMGIVFLAFAYAKLEDNFHEKRSKIMHNWENHAALLAKMDRYALKNDKYNYHIHMREAARHIKDSDLKLISGTDRSDRAFDQEIINAALDELVERVLIKAGK